MDHTQRRAEVGWSRVEADVARPWSMIVCTGTRSRWRRELEFQTRVCLERRTVADRPCRHVQSMLTTAAAACGTAVVDATFALAFDSCAAAQLSHRPSNV